MKYIPEYKVLGMMSGTSLDGLDLAICRFKKTTYWEFKIEETNTINYPIYWKNKLEKLHLKNIEEIKYFDELFGTYIGRCANNFIKNQSIDYISSHGHTIFHQPEKKFTLQIGNGEEIKKITKITTINNFREIDVSLNGQGAPLVPIGDLYLFPKYKYCLNLGGFANISIKNNNSIIAFDICPVNIILNYVAKKINLEYDNNGEIARNGKIIPSLLKTLNNLSYYRKSSPKSLSREWLEKTIIPFIDNYSNIQNILNTLCEHIAWQIGHLLKNKKTLITGGGAFNKYLIERIKYYSKSNIIIPSSNLIQFKEALIFSFLGVLRIRNEINCLKSVTGAKEDSCSGIIHSI